MSESPKKVARTTTKNPSGKETTSSGRNSSKRANSKKVSQKKINSKKTSTKTNSKETSSKQTKNRKINPKRFSLFILILILLVALACGIIYWLFFRSVTATPIDSDGYTHQEQFSDCIVIDGIDVSSYQGDDIDWDKVKASGVDYVIIRAAYRDYGNGDLHVDENFADNVKGATSAGLAVGAYIYSQAVTKHDVLEEALLLLSLVNKYDISMPLIMDYETASSGNLATAISSGELTSEEMTENVNFFTTLIRSQGYEAMIYANYNFLVNNLDLEQIASTCDVWLAHYTTSTDFGYSFTMWQCSAEETVDGISSYVDKDFWYVKKDGVTEIASSEDDNRISISECKISLDKGSYRLSGNTVEPDVTVKYDSEELTEGEDYTIIYVDNTSEGTAYAVIMGTGKYKDIYTISFEIK